MNNLIRNRIIAIFIAAAIIATMIVWGVSTIFYSTFMFDRVSNLAKSAASIYQKDLDECDYLEGLDDPLKYNEERAFLHELCQAFGMKYMYLYTIDPETAVRTYYIVAASDIDENTRVGELFPKGKQTQYARQAELDAFLGVKEYGFESVNNQYGNVYTWHYPCRDISGNIIALISVDYDVGYVTKMIEYNIYNIVLAVLVTLMFLLGVLLFILNRQVFSPIKRISVLMENYSPEAGFKASEVKSVGEIHDICLSFENMSGEIQKHIVDIRNMAAEKERISTELNMAANIQASQLLSEFPAFPDRTEFDIYASMTTAKEVGGDFYDFFFIDDDHLALVIADVSGKGIPAALFMMSSKMLINCYALLGGTPSEILSSVNGRICEHNKDNMFVTVWLGILEVSTGRLTCCNAGHEYPIIKKANGGFEALNDKHGLFVGVCEVARYKDYEVKLEKGDVLFVYTDGVPEATNGNSELFGEDRIISALDSAKDKSLEELLGAVKKATDEFVGDAPQFDDLTMLALKYFGKQDNAEAAADQCGA